MGGLMAETCRICHKCVVVPGKALCSWCLRVYAEDGTPLTREEQLRRQLGIARQVAEAVAECAGEALEQGATVQVPSGGRWAGTGTDGEREHRGARVVPLPAPRER